VLLEGVNVTANQIDILRDAGGKNKPYVITSSAVIVTDGTITLDFVNSVGDPQINGIEVIYIAPATAIPTRAPTRAPLPTLPVGNLLYRINSGSTNQVFVPPSNTVWDPDQFVATGLPYDICDSSSANTDIYCTARFFKAEYGVPFRYDIPVPASNRSYEVRLHFAEGVRTSTN